MSVVGYFRSIVRFLCISKKPPDSAQNSASNDQPPAK